MVRKCAGKGCRGRKPAGPEPPETILARKRGRGIFFVFEEIKGELLEHWNLILMAVGCNLANFINTIEKNKQ